MDALRADRRTIIASLDVLVLPSRSRSNWKEQFGRVLVDAMACGVPVIGSTCGEIPNVIGDAGLIFPEGDAAALRDRLRALQNDRSLRRDLAQRGRQRVLDRFTQEQIAQQTYEVYCDVMRPQAATHCASTVRQGKSPVYAIRITQHVLGIIAA